MNLFKIRCPECNHRCHFNVVLVAFTNLKLHCSSCDHCWTERIYYTDQSERSQYIQGRKYIQEIKIPVFEGEDDVYVALS